MIVSISKTELLVLGRNEAKRRYRARLKVRAGSRMRRARAAGDEKLVDTVYRELQVALNDTTYDPSTTISEARLLNMGRYQVRNRRIVV